MRKVIFIITTASVLFAFAAGAQTFTVYLYKGLRHPQVSELQTFLKQFPDIYPEGIVSGYFGSLTEKAVKKFQQKYGIAAVGTVGPITRAKLNELSAAAVVPAPVVSPAPAPAAEPAPTPAPVSEPAPIAAPAELVCKNRKVPAEYKTVQGAINAACAGDAILISPGSYKENLLIKTNGLILKSDGGARSAIINPDRGQIITTDGISTLTIDGLTLMGDFANIGIVFQAPRLAKADVLIQNSTVQNAATAISVTADDGLVTVKNNLILSGSAIAILDDVYNNATILVRSNTIAKNRTGYHLARSSGKHILNSNIIVSNTDIGVEIGRASVFNEEEILSASYNNVWGNNNYNQYSNKRGAAFALPGTGNLASDPDFIAVGEYKLRSTSYMINAGDPSLPNDPDGTRADIGAFPYDHRVQQYRKDWNIFSALLRWLFGEQ